MRTFKKDDRILQTNDKIIADAILNSGFVEVEATPKNKRNKRGN